MLLFLVLVRRLQTIYSLVGPEPLVQAVTPCVRRGTWIPRPDSRRSSLPLTQGDTEASP